MEKVCEKLFNYLFSAKQALLLIFFFLFQHVTEVHLRVPFVLETKTKNILLKQHGAGFGI